MGVVVVGSNTAWVAVIVAYTASVVVVVAVDNRRHCKVSLSTMPGEWGR